MLLGLETFSYHLAFAYRKMDVFGFIQRAADLGLDGVQLNIEVCYGYLAPFRIAQPKGYGAELGQGCFKVAEPPYEPEIVASYLLDAIKDGFSLESYAWQELANNACGRADRDQLLNYQDKAVVDSVNFVKKTRDDYIQSAPV